MTLFAVEQFFFLWSGPSDTCRSATASYHDSLISSPLRNRSPWLLIFIKDASSTDGKAAVSLEKLKLFRHFYIMVVCYVYFTR